MSLKPTFSPYWVILESYLKSLHLMINGALIFISGKCVNFRDIVGYKLGKKCRYSQEMCIIVIINQIARTHESTNLRKRYIHNKYHWGSTVYRML